MRIDASRQCFLASLWDVWREEVASAEFLRRNFRRSIVPFLWFSLVDVVGGVVVEGCDDSDLFCCGLVRFAFFGRALPLFVDVLLGMFVTLLVA